MIVFKILRLYVFNTLYILDVGVNALLGGDCRETISSRLGKGEIAGKPVHTFLAKCVDGLFFVITGQRDHCFCNITVIRNEYSISSLFSGEKHDS